MEVQDRVPDLIALKPLRIWILEDGEPEPAGCVTHALRAGLRIAVRPLEDIDDEE